MDQSVPCKGNPQMVLVLQNYQDLDVLMALALQRNVLNVIVLI